MGQAVGDESAGRGREAQGRGPRVADKERNTGKAAMDFVTRNGVALRTNARFHLHHDKTIIVDGDAIATGSFNFAVSAETVNSENLIVVRGMPEVSRRYLAHWQSRWDLGKPYAARQE